MEKKYGTIDTIPKTLEPLTMNKYKKNSGTMEKTTVLQKTLS